VKLGFWTLGMPEWSNAEIAQRAAALGYQGVDLRCVRRDGRPTIRPTNIRIEASPEEIEQTKNAFAEAGVEISSLLCYNASPTAGDSAAYDAFEREMVLHLQLARKLGSSRIRFVTEGPPDRVSWENYLVEMYRAVSRALDTAPGMDAVVENHIGRASSRQLLEAAEKVGDTRIGLEFSPEHSLVMQEDVLDLVERYTPHIHQICWADRKVVQHDLGRFDGEYYYVRYQSCWIGEGIVPAREIMEGLAQHGFDDYISLKWEKSATYGAHLPDGEKALAFFPGYIKQFGTFGT
jgi:sugar phosphate isomerase/epimerase